MSKVLADSLQGRSTGNEAPDCPKGLTVVGIATFSSNIDAGSLPTSDPGVSGRIWRSGNDLKISTG